MPAPFRPLVLFFIEDRLQLPASLQGAFLSAYLSGCGPAAVAARRTALGAGTHLAGGHGPVGGGVCSAAVLGAGDVLPSLHLHRARPGPGRTSPGPPLLAGAIAKRMATGTPGRRRILLVERGGQAFNLALAAALALPCCPWATRPEQRSEDAAGLAYALSLTVASCRVPVPADPPGLRPRPWLLALEFVMQRRLSLPPSALLLASLRQPSHGPRPGALQAGPRAASTARWCHASSPTARPASRRFTVQMQAHWEEMWARWRRHLST